MFPQTHWIEKVQLPPGDSLCGRIPLSYPSTPEYTNRVNYFKLIIQKFAFKKKT
jgi:hypothetical protein